MGGVRHRLLPMLQGDRPNAAFTLLLWASGQLTPREIPQSRPSGAATPQGLRKAGMNSHILRILPALYSRSRSLEACLPELSRHAQPQVSNCVPPGT